MGAQRTTTERGVAFWLRGGLCDALAGPPGTFESWKQPEPDWGTPRISPFQLAYLTLLSSVAKSPSVFLILPQSLLFKCNSVQEGNVSFFI